MLKNLYPVIVAALFAYNGTVGADVPERKSGSAVERHLSEDEPRIQWVHDPEVMQERASDQLVPIEVAHTQANTVKLKGLVPPIKFASGVAQIPPSTIANLQSVLQGLSNRTNVRLHLLGHADNQPLSASLAVRYGDNEGLSRERAGEVAELFHASLALQPAAISYEWAGDALPVASNDTPAGRAENRRVEVEVWYDELADAKAQDEMVVASDVRRIKVCRIDTVCKLKYRDGHNKRARVQNLIAPLRYESSSIEVTTAFVERVNRTLFNLRDKHNVVVKFIGHTDSQPLDERTRRIYGDHEGLAKARAWRVALAVQERLALHSSAVDAGGMGDRQPLANNNIADGQSRNRRVAVEFWYDDPLQELPDEPRLCPAEADDLPVTKVYQPPWGSLPELELEQGRIQLPNGMTDQLQRAMDDLTDYSGVRLRFVGYTRNATLDRRTASVYGDDIGLSAARARRAMDQVREIMGLEDQQVEFEGRGFVHADDVVNGGFVQGDASLVEIQVVYDTFADNEDLDGIELTPLQQELVPENAFALNLMRITVDGKPVDDPGRSSADLQRCTDVALQEADIQFAFDNLTAQRRLSVDARPVAVAVQQAGEGLIDPVSFLMHANYAHFIEKAEVRLFEDGDSVRGEPLAVIALGTDGTARWSPDGDTVDLSPRPLKYVLRAYGEDGAFDETIARPLWLRAATAQATSVDPVAPAHTEQTLLAGYGSNQLALQNIRLSSGTVRVQGSGIPPQHDVWVAGRRVPVNTSGRFISEQILPEGAHTVEVAVLDQEGNGELFLRDLLFEPKDWFYVGMADLTLAQTQTDGAAKLLEGDYDRDASAVGRLAFYANGKFGDKWRLTSSLDTREEPVGDMFKNFVNKSPDALLRRIDPDYHYPTFGDDSHVEEHAPTSGKFYLKVGRRESHAVWGNYDVSYNQNELARVDRGLYGANLHHEAAATTSFGERRFVIDGFAAEPGTIPARQEFRGTGGSLYFLRHQDLLIGSERLRIELRDSASGLVTGVVNLRPGVDYEIDYLQGTVLLAEPLASTVHNDLLIRSSAVSGDEAYLVTRYEYTPGFDEIEAVATGAQAHYWIGDNVKVGLTGNFNELDEADTTLTAGHIVVRKSANSWLKLQAGRSDGQIGDTWVSDDGGFGFNAINLDPSEDQTSSHRVDLNVGLNDFIEGNRGRITLYSQHTDAGYSAPGIVTPLATDYYGGTLSMPLTKLVSVTAKTDTLAQSEGLQNERHELNVAVELSDQWTLSTGVRQDTREDDSPIIAATQDLGERTDAVLQVGYDSLGRWKLYGFLQDTVAKSDSREDNGRLGVGGSYRVSDKIGFDAEISNGDTGAGGRFGTAYNVSEQTSLYLNYALENERTDNVLHTRRGREGNLVAGAKSRLSDSMSVYAEERYRHGLAMTGLTHATGVTYKPAQSWNLGVSTDMGTLRDLQSGAETERNAVGARASYVLGTVSISTGLEFRNDQTEQSDLSVTQRDTWLFRSSFKVQATDSNRLVGKLGHSTSDSSLGQFYDGGFTEASLGYAFRPVAHDRLNALVKYTYFYNVPTTDQVTLKNAPAQYIQKSHVAAIDVTYDLTPRWSVGGKYAYRLGEISIDRDDLEFFDNRAHLYVLRTDYRFREHWELLLEARQLSMPDFGETRSGGLVMVSRMLGRNLKVGAGYNFADFSDDLTDLNFDHRGLFLNVTGML